jgi:uncharacterized phage-associated protein
MSYNSIAVANRVIDILRDIKGADYNPNLMELVKLCYIAHGVFLADERGGLFDADEVIEAYPYGAVPVNLCNDFLRNGIIILEKSTTCLDVILPEGCEDYKRLYEIIKYYSSWNPFVLSDITQKEGSPWCQTVKEYGFYAVIPNYLIKQYYKKI